MKNNDKKRQAALLAAQLEDARKNLKKPGDKLPITMYDYFVLALMVVVFIGHYSYWWLALASPIFWERPRLLYRQAVYRLKLDKDLRASIKLMESEMKLLKEDE